MMIGSGLKKLAQEYGLKVSHGVAYGSLQGYAATFSEGAGYKQIMFSTRLPDQNAFLFALGQVDLKAAFRIQSLNVTVNAIQVVFQDNPGTMAKIREFLAWFLPLLQQHGAAMVNVCPACGCELGAGKWIMINGVASYMHGACAEKAHRDIQGADHAAKQSRTGSYGTGLVGALIGALIGAVVWALVLNLGYVASLVGLLIGWLAEKGYTLLGGKTGKGKVAILAVAVVVGVIAGTFGAEILDVMNTFDASFVDSAELVFKVFEMDSEAQGIIIGNIAMGLLFAALGVFAMLKKASDDAAGNKVIDLD